MINRTGKRMLLAGAAVFLLLLSACKAPESPSSLPASSPSEPAASSTAAPALTLGSAAAPPTTAGPAATSAVTTAAKPTLPTTTAAPKTDPPPSTTTAAAPAIKGMAMGEKASSLFVDFQATSAKPDEKDARLYVVEFTMTNVAAAPHEYAIFQRIKLMDAQRTGVTVKSLTDSGTGADLNGSKLESGQTVRARAVFSLPADYQPVAFAYTYDIMGFGIFTYRLP